MFRVKSPQDFGAAIVFMLIGLAGIYFGKDLTFGSSARMGPGYFPTIISFLILLLGVIVGLRAIVIEGPSIETVQFRPLLFVIASILIFGALIDRFGLAISAVALTLVAAYARRNVEPEGNARARRGPGDLLHRRLRIWTWAAAAGVVGPLRWNSIFSII